jgi:protein-S-isoprenylcysteine O-methyltransferase Ste14
MNLWIARAAIVIAIIATVAIRAPHGRHYRDFMIARKFKTTVDSVLLGCVSIGFLLPLIWVAFPVFSFADYTQHVGLLAAGVACLVGGLFLFFRSHADLGRYWSVTLEVRDDHRLITSGVYRRIRHPMYTALFLYAIGQALVVPNWVVGPAHLVPFAILCALRLRTEEKMMLEVFVDDYAAYVAATKRLIPGLW